MGGNLSASFHPATWVAAGMQYRKNDNSILFTGKEDLIRESAGQGSPKVLMDYGGLFRIT